MSLFIALLRGVNVGGNSRIKMAELKQVLESAGFDAVQTYIQSGNVLFEASGEEAILKERMEQAIAGHFGFRPPVVLRTAEELGRLLHSCPFTAGDIAAAQAANTEGESLYVSLFQDAPPEQTLARLRAFEGEGDRFHAVGRDIVMLFHHSIRNSKLATQVDKLKPPGTVRNWNTLTKLYELTGK